MSVSLLFGASAEDVLAGFTTVWMHGDHNMSTARELSEAIRRASDLDGADVMVDFSDVQSIDGTAVDVIVSATASLQQRSLVLLARRPSPCTRRLVEKSGFAWLFPHDPRLLAGGGDGELPAATFGSSRKFSEGANRRSG